MIFRLQNILHTFRKQIGGVSAVEFALIFPIMMVLLLGSVAVGQAISVQRKITLLSRSLADIVAQSASTTNQELDNLLNAASLIVAPYSSAPLSMTIVSIWKDSGGRTTVDWSRSKGNVTSSPTTIPDNIPVANGRSVIAARVTYEYTVPFAERIIGDTLMLSSEIYMQPRVTDRVTKM